MLSFYFIELLPSVIIILVLWRSNLELRYKKLHDSNRKTTLISSHHEDNSENILNDYNEGYSRSYAKMNQRSSNQLSVLSSFSEIKYYRQEDNSNLLKSFQSENTSENHKFIYPLHQTPTSSERRRSF